MCRVYDTTKFSRFIPGNSLVMRIIIKRDDSYVVTKTSKVFMIPKVAVPATRYEEGEKIVNPPPPEIVMLKTALKSPIKKNSLLKDLLLLMLNVRI
ncbi:hypothetical protein ACF0H5_012512 [Mactra antiquata]